MEQKYVYLAHGPSIEEEARTVVGRDQYGSVSRRPGLVGGRALTHAAYHHGNATIGRPLNLTDIMVVYMPSDFQLRYFICDAMGPDRDPDEMTYRLTQPILLDFLSKDTGPTNRPITDHLIVTHPDMVDSLDSYIRSAGFSTSRFTEHQ